MVGDLESDYCMAGTFLVIRWVKFEELKIGVRSEARRWP